MFRLFLSHLQALQERDPSFVNVYGAFWDPERLSACPI